MIDRRTAFEQNSRRINRTAKTLMRDLSFVWFVGFTMSGKEYITQKMLMRAGCVSYLPLQRKWRRVNRTTRAKRRFAYPAIPGALLIGVPRSSVTDWHHLFGETPLYGLLGVAGKATAFTGHTMYFFVDDNQRSFEVPDAQQHMRTYYEFEVGDTVDVVDGPFEGKKYRVEAIRGPDARITIELLGKTQQVDIALDKLEKAA